MTERQNRIIIQILITVAFLVSFGPLFGIADFFQTSIIIDDFRQNGWQPLADSKDFLYMLFIYTAGAAVIAACGVWGRNLPADAAGLVVAGIMTAWLWQLLGDFRPYLLTTWEGRIYLLALGMHIVMFLTAAFGIMRVLYRLRKKILTEE